jgi:hypothetical protein
MPSQSHSSRFHHPHNSGLGVQIIKLSINRVALTVENYKTHNYNLKNELNREKIQEN